MPFNLDRYTRARFIHKLRDDINHDQLTITFSQRLRANRFELLKNYKKTQSRRNTSAWCIQPIGFGSPKRCSVCQSAANSDLSATNSG